MANQTSSSPDTCNAGTPVLFPKRTYTITSKRYGEPTFINGPYTAAPGGPLKHIALLVTSGSNTPVVDAHVSLTIPDGFKYANGLSGKRDFITDDDGILRVGGITGAPVPGPYTLIASSGDKTAKADVTVTGLAQIADIPL
ncbi:hypothetical protein HU724_008450 [Pseudomonas iranensis]|uniref:hypothetical protein n=1 Tax=Pseudomonas iranensis TaxID=2745503 RepID=UPI001647F318|nr:hypothetical protein [Pseudomonas iranensis]QXI24296.1 hypothetical protein HU724_008450 [Pseudomonas iranensis]